ncbi:MAG: SUMF1/EgtB/PvdO family nonheme iron enzyme [Desulfobacterales bacterium]|nr:SUMF1/EgtB/PvdO family nonheme iron enzyme [Desulfobacterales bacterium]
MKKNNISGKMLKGLLIAALALFPAPSSSPLASEDGKRRMKPGGAFTYTIDQTLKPAMEHAAGAPSRRVGVAVNPDGSIDQYIVGEIIVKSRDPAIIEEIVKRYNGKVLHDGKLGPVHPSTPANRVRKIPKRWDYQLIRVDPATANLKNLARRMTAFGLTGKFTFSSLDALRIGAIVLEQRELQRQVSISMVGALQRCPCHSTTERTDAAAGPPPLDAFDYGWFSTLDSQGAEYLGVAKAWQLLDGLGIPDDLPNDLMPYNWEPVRLGIIDGGFEPNDDWPGGVLPAWCQSYGGSFTEYSTNCGGRNEVSCTGGLPCPWHGTLVYGAAAALSNNLFGAAGSAAGCNGPLVEVMLSVWDGTLISYGFNLREQVRDGADVVNMSGGGECNWWCENLFIITEDGGIDYTGPLRDAVREALMAGVLVVAAAGNDGDDLGDLRFIPCEIGGVMCVSSVSFSCNAAACFNHRNVNHGGGVNIWAPDGLEVWAPAAGDAAAPFPAIEREPHGTSIATPYVSGVLAMVKALYPASDRDMFDHIAAHSLLATAAWSDVETSWHEPTVRVSTSDRVNSGGGLINAYETVRLGAIRRGWSEEEWRLDEHEPNDEPAAPTPIGLGETLSGVLSSDADRDYYRFSLDELYHVTAAIQNETYPFPSELQIISPTMGASGRTVSASLEPGNYTLFVEQSAVVGPHPFHCYDLSLTGFLTYIPPDVFDDENPLTPAPGGWSPDRNDAFDQRTLLVLPPDGRGESAFLGYSYLNFDTMDDVDYFDVALPDGPGVCSCAAGDGFLSRALVITILSDLPVRATLLGPDDLSPIHPYREGWEHYEGFGNRVIRIICPREARTSRGRRVATENGHIRFFTEPDPVRTSYFLRVEYEYLNEEYCGLSPRPPWLIRDFIYSPLEEPVNAIFPGVEVFNDCLSNPACDPAEEYWALNWRGGDLGMVFEYQSSAGAGAFEVSLLNRAGKALGAAQTERLAAKRSGSPSKDLKRRGKAFLSVAGLDKDWYFLRIDAPFPTLFSYRGLKPAAMARENLAAMAPGAIAGAPLFEAGKKNEGFLAKLKALGMEFKYVKPGAFMRGAPSRRHRVTLGKGFYIQTTEVTQGQWRAVMGKNPSHFKKCGADCPVERVSWNDARVFIKKLNRRVGSSACRLPTEAEWEYASRAGGEPDDFSGDADVDRVAWYSENSIGKPHPVGKKAPNALGLYDMSGNVWEWCGDWYGEHPADAVVDPAGPSLGSYRVRRGGSWYTDAMDCRSSNRDRRKPDYRMNGVGLRLALTPDP